MDEYTIFVYFLLDPETNEIKIGQSKQPRLRIRQICTELGRELIVIAIIKDKMPLEQIMHIRFQRLQSRGVDWFQASPEIIGFINNLHFNEAEPDPLENGSSWQCSDCGAVFTHQNPDSLERAKRTHINQRCPKRAMIGDNHRAKAQEEHEQ